MSAHARLVLLTKDPVPGRVKTRLAPHLGDVGAARLHRAFALETLRRALRSGLPVHVALRGALDGPFAEALRAGGATVGPQAHGDLGQKLTAALRGPGRRIALGTDCVVFDPAWLVAAASAPTPVAFGPSTDGGYWCVSVEGTGGPSATERIFSDIPWSTPDTLAASRAAAARAGLPVSELPQSFDVDDQSDLDELRRDPRCSPDLAALIDRLRAAAGRGD